jgi:hypothetical protein
MDRRGKADQGADQGTQRRAEEGFKEEERPAALMAALVKTTRASAGGFSSSV